MKKSKGSTSKGVFLRVESPADESRADPISVEIEEGLNLDLDENGKLVGLEVLDATQRYSLADIFNISTENLILEKEVVGVDTGPGL